MSEATRREAAEIRREMAELRRELNVDAEGIVESARTVTNWRYYVRTYPWASLGVAAALGYLVVPRRLEVIRPDAETLAKLARRDQLVVKQRSETEPKKGFFGSMFQFISSMVVRGALAYAGQQAGRLFGEQAGREDAQPDRGQQPMPPGVRQKG
ncbi:MAG: hypothetical protein KY476_13000 [Planctomycetes bacterium]|nr:hypothetical protein [Planctomycetota bacterium]